jgi:hypothetical protein
VATQKKTLENQNKTKIILCKKFKRVYSGFIPLNLAEMTISWENGNLFE